MVRSLIRTIRGPSRDPRMEFISRPLPKGLRDEDVVSALEKALGANPNPAYLVETLPEALHQVTGVDYQVLDRSTWDVTGAFGKATNAIFPNFDPFRSAALTSCDARDAELIPIGCMTH